MRTEAILDLPGVRLPTTVPVRMNGRAIGEAIIDQSPEGAKAIVQFSEDAKPIFDRWGHEVV